MKETALFIAGFASGIVGGIIVAMLYSVVIEKFVKCKCKQVTESLENENEKSESESESENNAATGAQPNTGGCSGNIVDYTREGAAVTDE